MNYFALIVTINEIPKTPKEQKIANIVCSGTTKISVILYYLYSSTLSIFTFQSYI